MSNSETNGVGSIVWRDLTVENADEIRQFYSEVIGWKSEPHNMGEYSDFNILTPDSGETVAGICHARGPNATIPPQWLMYVNVQNLDESIQRSTELGGEIVHGPRSIGESRFCIVRDPAGAVIGLIATSPKTNEAQSAVTPE